MIKNLKLSAFLSLGLTLSACAPTILGSQIFTPVVSSSALTPVSVKAGQTVYVQYSYPRGALDVADARFDNLKISFDQRAANGDVTSQETPATWLNMTVMGLPSTWQVTLADAAIRKEVLGTTFSMSSTNIRYLERLRVVYKVTLPANASGREVALLKFMDGTREIGDVPLTINVGGASGPSVGAQF